METAVKISILCLLTGCCSAGVLPFYTPQSYQYSYQRQLPSHNQHYYYYPESFQQTYNPYYYTYQSIPSYTPYQTPYLPSYDGFPTTLGYYPIPIYDFQINILRVLPDVHPRRPKPNDKPHVTTTPQTTTEIELTDVDDYDSIETLDTKIVPQTSGELITTTSKENNKDVEIVTQPTENSKSTEETENTEDIDNTEDTENTEDE